MTLFGPHGISPDQSLTPLHSLRLGVGECKVVGRRSLRGTWELTPPDPTGLAVVAERAGRLLQSVRGRRFAWRPAMAVAGGFADQSCAAVIYTCPMGISSRG